MIKYIDYIYGDSSSSVLELVHPGSMVKTAEYSPEIVEFIKKLLPKDGITYALINALSSGEYYGSNRNGDYFPEDSLIKYHDTFQSMGHVYQHHVNKDPMRAYGTVPFSFFNPKMHRVELIIEVSNDKAMPIIERLDKGDLPAVSMGCKVPYDVCSICGNRAKTRIEYCEHLREKMNVTMSDGRKAYAINLEPKFFDISFVTIPAERTAGVISKILLDSNKKASYNCETIKVDTLLEKTAAMESMASINKEITGKIETASEDPKKLIISSQKRLSQDQIEKLSSYPMEEVLSTMLALRIMPVREDFQKLSLYNLGYKEEADLLEKEGMVFDVDPEVKPVDLLNVSIGNFNEKIAMVLGDDIIEMANTKPLIISRILVKHAMYNEGQQNPYLNPARSYTGKTVEPSLFRKIFFGQKEEPTMSPTRNPALAMGTLGALYSGLIRLQNVPNPGQFKSFILKFPWIAPLFLATVGSVMSMDAQEAHYRNSPLYAEQFTKTAAALDKYLRNIIIAVPASYYFSYKAEEKARRGVPITGIENFVRKHPLLVSYAAGIGATKLTSNLTKVSSVVSRLDNESLDSIYNQLIKED